MIQKLVKRLLEREGYFVSTANDGVDGLNALQSQNFGLVLMVCCLLYFIDFELRIKITKATIIIVVLLTIFDIL